MTENRVRIRADLDDKVSGKLDKIRDRFDTLGKSKGAQSLIMGVGVGAGARAFDLLGGAVSSATSFVESSIAAASDLNETLTKSEQIFGKNSKAVEDWASTAATSFGQSKRAALDVASTFAGLFSTVGLALDDATDKAQKLTQLGSDLASFFNTDVATATAALRSGLAGESEPLRQFNVFLSETAVAAKATELGMKKVNGQFTEGQKVTARYAIIMDQTKTAQGDFARTSDGMANQQRTLQAELEDTSARFGKSLIPVVIKAQQAFIDFFSILDGSSGQLAGLDSAIEDSLVNGTRRGLEQSKAALEEGLNQLSALPGQNDVLSSIVAGSQIADLRKRLADVNYALEHGLDDRGITRLVPKVTNAINQIANANGDLADSAKKDYKSVSERFDDMVTAMEKSTNDAIDKAFDPLITKQDALANLSEIAANRRILASDKSTKAEKKDASDKLTSLEKDNAKYLTDLAAAGQTNSTAYKKGMAELDTEIDKSSGSIKTALMEVRRQIKLTALLSTKLGVTLFVQSTQNYKEHATGGPVVGNVPVIVGEKGPELFVPSGAGDIVPNNKLGSGGGTTVINFNSTWPPTPQQAREIAQIVTRQQGIELQRTPPTLGRT